MSFYFSASSLEAAMPFMAFAPSRLASSEDWKNMKWAAEEEPKATRMSFSASCDTNWISWSKELVLVLMLLDTCCLKSARDFKFDCRALRFFKTPEML